MNSYFQVRRGWNVKRVYIEKAGLIESDADEWFKERREGERAFREK
jgi:hypothetical protein